MAGGVIGSEEVDVVGAVEGKVEVVVVAPR